MGDFVSRCQGFRPQNAFNVELQRGAGKSRFGFGVNSRIEPVCFMCLVRSSRAELCYENGSVGHERSRDGRVRSTCLVTRKEEEIDYGALDWTAEVYQDKGIYSVWSGVACCG